MFKTDVIFSGYYGMRNTGDDAFVEVAQWASNKYWNVDNIRFLAKTVNLPSTKAGAKGFPLTIPKTYSIQQAMLLRNTKWLIMAGGSIFNSVEKGSIKDVASTLKQQGNKIKLGAVGVSVGPFKNIEHEKQIIEYLKIMEFISVRDNRSYNFLKSLNLDFEPIASFDLAALLPEVYSVKEKSFEMNKEMIGISFNNEESHFNGDLNKEKKRRNFIIELLKSLKNKRNYMFRFFIINDNDKVGDFSVTQEVINKSGLINYEIIQYNKSVEETWNKISECSLMISSRLHASIFACFANIPFFLIEYHEKCTDFLNDVGQNSNYILGDGDVDPNRIVYQISEILENKESYIPPKFKNEMIEKSRLNFTNVNFEI
ncbi:Polysaccharide pyruvyl transferase family protein WcaK [Maribacter sedimenticola]|uniref:Polysaccharide pyruvyl transferase family protein WcaK n=1 Tax=Maribacter sedimenticola TaxID=228956 RepID=A0ABY1SJW7_9FLAO|nr:polysaccharide pyruvyl transferase family protein [Maribacter sedimenticola]SNR66977.1 Polysaccharide pyruvyl transferase family protein WcaK [Maribacter sedimenticola]